MALVKTDLTANKRVDTMPQDRHGVDRNSISCEVIANTKPALQREAGFRPRSVALKGIAAIGL